MKITSILRKRCENGNYEPEEVHAIYATNALYNLAQSLLSIFIPIYVFNIAWKNNSLSSNETTNGMLWVICFFATLSLSSIINAILGPKTIFRLSLKKSISLSSIFLVFSYVFLFLAKENSLLLFPSAWLQGMFNIFYWVPYHVFFIKKADDGDKKYGNEVGKRDFLVGLSSALGPLLGSLIISQWGFEFLYAGAIFLLLISNLPITFFVHESSHRTHEVKDVYSNFLFNKNYITTTLALSGSIVSNVIFTIFWSLMLYFGLKNFVEIGLITTLSGILATILLVAVGKLIDSRGKLKVHFFGVVVNTVLHLTRPFYNTSTFLYTNGILDNVNSPIYGVPFNSAVYEKSLNGSVSDFIVYRELTMNLARFLCLVFVGFVLYFSNSWIWTFYLGAFGSVLTILINF